MGLKIDAFIYMEIKAQTSWLRFNHNRSGISA